jgi:hypothetical protein
VLVKTIRVEADRLIMPPDGKDPGLDELPHADAPMLAVPIDAEDMAALHVVHGER